MEYENKYASKGVGGAGLGLGIAGTALGLLSGNGILGGILGGGNASCEHDAVLRARIAELETEVKLRDATIYTDSRLNDFRNYVDAKFDGVNAAICQQNVYNATNTATLNCLSNQVAQLMSLTKVVIPTATAPTT
jgi:hypothetical protein